MATTPEELYSSDLDGFLNKNSLSQDVSITQSNSEAIIWDGAINASKIKDLKVDTITVSVTGYVRSWKTSFTDTSLGWYESSEGIYFGSAADVTKFKFTVSNWHIDLVWWTIDATSTIDWRLASVLADAIDASGHFADDAINTATGTIIDSFSFGVSWALQIWSYVNWVSWDVRISPTGILARSLSGATTFSLNGSTGVAVLNWLVVGTNVWLGTAQTSGNVTSIIGSTVNTWFVNALGGINAATVDASISITTPTIDGGDIIGSTVNIPNATTPLFSVDIAGNCKVSSLARNDFHWFTVFESIDGYGQGSNGAGSSVTVSGGGVDLVTGTTAGNYANIQKYLPGGFTWDKNRKFKILVNFSSQTNQTCFIGTGFSGANEHIGFYISGATSVLRATVGDGTYENLETIGNLTAGSLILEAELIVGVGVNFYKNGVFQLQLTDNLPTGDGYAAVLLTTNLNTETIAAKSVTLGWLDVWQAN